MLNLSNTLNKPVGQIVLLGLVCFCCPGMFNAISGLGAGGSMSSDIGLTDAANGALYICFSIVGFFAGSITNKMGVKCTLAIGSFGYMLYTIALLVYDLKKISGLVIASGAILGCLAALFWSAQGSIMLSYPEEKDKGKFVAIFWGLFNAGGILGSLMALCMNLTNHQEGVSATTYIAFIAVMIIGTFLSFLMAKPSQVFHANGSPVVIEAAVHWKSELKGVINVWKEWRILALIPAFLASNWFYAYQFRVNSIYFDPSTRALNDLVYWTMQVVGSTLIGYLLDYEGFSRRTRGLIALVILAVVINCVWLGGFVFQLTFEADYHDHIHWTSPKFGGPFFLFMMYGFSDSIYQTYLYWLMGAMSNDPALLARYAGFYKAMQSAGAAAAFGIDSSTILLRYECLICWILVFISFPFIWLVVRKITSTSLSEKTIDNDVNSENLSTDDSLDEKPEEIL